MTKRPPIILNIVIDSSQLCFDDCPHCFLIEYDVFSLPPNSSCIFVFELEVSYRLHGLNKATIWAACVPP